MPPATAAGPTIHRTHTHLFQRHLAGVKLLQLLLVLAQDGGQVLRQRLRLQHSRRGQMHGDLRRDVETCKRRGETWRYHSGLRGGSAKRCWPGPYAPARRLWARCAAGAWQDDSSVLRCRCCASLAGSEGRPTWLRVSPSASSCRVCVSMVSDHVHSPSQAAQVHRKPVPAGVSCRQVGHAAALVIRRPPPTSKRVKPPSPTYCGQRVYQ